MLINQFLLIRNSTKPLKDFSWFPLGNLGNKKLINAPKITYRQLRTNKKELGMKFTNRQKMFNHFNYNKNNHKNIFQERF